MALHILGLAHYEGLGTELSVAKVRLLHSL